jgi:hypothetical protein
MQFIHDALKCVYRDLPGLSLAFRASYRPIRADEAAARECDLHILQVTNLAIDPWAALVPARAKRLRVPALQLPAVFHALAPRVHVDHVLRGRQPYYLARGNRVLEEFARRHRAGEDADSLISRYLRYAGPEIETAPRLFEMNLISMRRLGRQADFDPWRAIEPRLLEERFFWSVKHPTLKLGLMLLDGVLEALALPFDKAGRAVLGTGPEYHEPYHAPVHPRLAERLELAWAAPQTRYRFFQHYFTAAGHARRYITGDFRREFALNRAIHDARTRADASSTAARLEACRAYFPPQGQADFWYGRVLQRLARDDEAAAHFQRGIARARRTPHPVPHRADLPLGRVENWLGRCRAAGTDESDQVHLGVDPVALPAQIARLEAEEARLLAQIRRIEARRRLAALRQEA